MFKKITSFISKFLKGVNNVNPFTLTPLTPSDKRETGNSYKLPFSKQTIEFAKWESYIASIALFVFVWFEKDVSGIIVIATLFIGGYRIVQSSYLKMAREEHLLDMKIRAKELGLSGDYVSDAFIDEELQHIHQEFDEELSTTFNESGY